MLSVVSAAQKVRVLCHCVPLSSLDTTVLNTLWRKEEILCYKCIQNSSSLTAVAAEIHSA